jgi:hypothetical protein
VSSLRRIAAESNSTPHPTLSPIEAERGLLQQFDLAIDGHGERSATTSMAARGLGFYGAKKRSIKSMRGVGEEDAAVFGLATQEKGKEDDELLKFVTGKAH